MNRRALAAAGIFFTASALILLAMGCGLFGPQEPPRAAGFKHSVHAAKGVTCAACHQEYDKDYEASASPGMPTYGTCLVCHGPAADRTPYPYEAELQRHAPGEAFATKPAYGDLKFSHALHAEKSVPCGECHADPDQPRAFGVPPPAHAERCAGCHKERGVSAECSVCHQETRRDRAPQSHLATFWRQVHGREPEHAWDTAHERSCALCHSKAFCDDCHKVEKPVSHTEFFRQRGHGITAGIERESCMACHQENFCIRCHREEEPRSHLSASWGGSTSQHCVSCHDLGQSRCSVCHKSTPSHAQAEAVPAPPHPRGTANCYTCHLRPPHADNHVTPCTACHKG